jgi:hypothetical protein
MIQLSEEEITGVICLHCRMQTPVPNNRGEEHPAKVSTKSHPRISIVRCVKCGGEAPYLANEIVVMKTILSSGLFAA